jgi:hypothetical protein
MSLPEIGDHLICSSQDARAADRGLPEAYLIGDHRIVDDGHFAVASIQDSQTAVFSPGSPVEVMDEIRHVAMTIMTVATMGVQDEAMDGLRADLFIIVRSSILIVTVTLRNLNKKRTWLNRQISNGDS